LSIVRTKLVPPAAASNRYMKRPGIIESLARYQGPFRARIVGKNPSPLTCFFNAASMMRDNLLPNIIWLAWLRRGVFKFGVVLEIGIYSKVNILVYPAFIRQPINVKKLVE